METIIDPSTTAILDKLQEAEESGVLAMAHVGNRIRNCIELGAMLRAKKKEVGHGNFLQWMEANVTNTEVAERAGFSRVTAARYMKLSEAHEAKKLDLENASSVKRAFQLAGILPPSDSEPSGAGSEQPQLLVKIARVGAMVASEFAKRPIEDLDAQERRVWADRLKPLVDVWEKLVA